MTATPSAPTSTRPTRSSRPRPQRAEQRKRTTRLAIAAGVAGILGVGGLLAYQRAGDNQDKDRLQPATPTTSTTQLVSQQDLLGIWAVEADWLNGGFPWLWTFNADGSGTSSPHADTAQDAWDYSLSGNALNAQDRLGGCRYSWTVREFDAGALDLDVVDHCGNTGTWDRPDPPVTRLAGRHVPRHATDDRRDPASGRRGRGRRLAHAGSGMLLAIEADDPAHATYRLDDKGALARDPIDTGTVDPGWAGRPHPVQRLPDARPMDATTRTVPASP